MFWHFHVSGPIRGNARTKILILKPKPTMNPDRFHDLAKSWWRQDVTWVWNRSESYKFWKQLAQ